MTRDSDSYSCPPNTHAFLDCISSRNFFQLDVFNESHSKEDLLKELKKLCNSKLDESAADEVITSLQNFHSYDIDERELASYLKTLVEDLTDRNLKKLLKVAPSFMSSLSMESLVKNIDSSKLKQCPEELGFLINWNYEITDLSSVANVFLNVSDKQNLLKILDSVSKAICLTKKIKHLASFFNDLFIVLNKKSAVKEALSEYCRKSGTKALFEIISIMLIGHSSDSFKAFSECLENAQEVIRTGVRCGEIMDHLDSNLVKILRHYFLSFVQEVEFDELVSQFLAACCRSSRTIPRSELIAEILMLSSESDDLKYFKYINALIDSSDDQFNFSVNDFKTALDFVEYVKPSIVCDFYSIMVKIALKMSQKGNDHVNSELCLIIRKQLASLDEATCLNGVAGALAVVSSRAVKIEDIFDLEQATCSQAATKCLPFISAPKALRSELLSLAFMSSTRFAYIGKYFFNHISKITASNDFPEDLMESFNDTVSSDLQEFLVTDQADEIPEDGEVHFNLLDSDDLVGLKVYPQIVNPSSSARASLLSDYLKLISIFEKKINDGSLENIDMIMRFPSVLPSKKSEQQLVFSSYLTALNFYRQSINCFADQKDLSMQEAIRKRILHVSQIADELKEIISRCQTFSCLRNSPLGSFVNPGQLRNIGSQRTTLSSAANDILLKVDNYSHDRHIAHSDPRHGIKLKSEEDLYHFFVPLSIEVLKWLSNGIDLFAKSKYDVKLTEDEFVVLFNELKMQVRKGPITYELIDVFDKAISVYLEAVKELNEESDLIYVIPKYVLEMISQLRTSQKLDTNHLTKIKEIFSKTDTNDAGNLKVRIALCTSDLEEAEIVELLAKHAAEIESSSSILEILSLMKHYKCSFRSIYEIVFGKKGSDFFKLAFEILITEIPKSSLLDQHLWLMTQLEQLTQKAKSDYSANCTELLLRYSKEVVDNIIKHTMSQLERELVDSKDEVLNVLKKFQQFTRTVQIISNHAKASQDKNLIKRIPPLKKSLEMSLVRVKQMLQSNNCQSAFWVGNLKHKGLDGKEVASQIPLKRQEAEEDSSEGQDDATSDHAMSVDPATDVNEAQDEATLALSL